MNRPPPHHPAAFRIEHWPPTGRHRIVGAVGVTEARAALLAHADRLGAAGAAGRIVLVVGGSGEPAVARPVSLTPSGP